MSRINIKVGGVEKEIHSFTIEGNIASLPVVFGESLRDYGVFGLLDEANVFHIFPREAVKYISAKEVPND